MRNFIVDNMFLTKSGVTLIECVNAEEAEKIVRDTLVADGTVAFEDRDKANVGRIIEVTRVLVA